jgi:hypothetical protein
VRAIEAARVGPQASEMIIRCQMFRSIIVYQHGKQPTDDREVHGRLRHIDRARFGGFSMRR